MADENAQDQDTDQAATAADAEAVEAARDAERALEAVQAEAASELPPPAPAAADAEAVEAARDAERALEAVQAEAASELPPPRPARARARTPATAPGRTGARCVRASSSPTACAATVVVAVVERVRHPKYGKTVQRTKKLYVHDAEDSAKVGDRVRVQETRPISKLKRWRLTEVVERAR